MSDIVTLRDVKKLVKKEFEKEPRLIINHKIEPYAEVKRGMLSFQYKLTVQTAPAAMKVTTQRSFIPAAVVDVEDADAAAAATRIIESTFFVKSSAALQLSRVESSSAAAGDDDDDDQEIDRVPRARVQDDTFNEEVHFFNRVYPLLRKQLSLTESCVKDFAPKCLLAKKDLLIFRDLQIDRYSNPPQTFLTTDQFVKMIDVLASFHAASMITERKIGKSLKEFFPNAFEEKYFLAANASTKLRDHVSRTVDVTLNFVSALIDHYDFAAVDFDVEFAREKLIKGAMARENSRLNVICHGDLWKNNFMFSDESALLVDYQLLRYAPLSCDLSMLLYLNLRRKSRIELEYDLVNLYSEKLRRILLESGAVANAAVPTSEEVRGCYEESKFVGSFYSLVYLPSMLVESGIDELLSDKRKLSKYLFEDRVSIFLPKLKEDPRFSGRIRRLLQEFLTLYRSTPL